jgi:H+/Cl- antiporter ClcA
MKLIKGILFGIGIGLIATLALYALVAVLEFLNFMSCGHCGLTFRDCLYFDCSYDLPKDGFLFPPCVDTYGFGCFPVWRKTYFFNALIFCAIIGEIIGIIYGVAKQIQIWRKEKNEEEINWKIELEKERTNLSDII